MQSQNIKEVPDLIWFDDVSSEYIQIRNFYPEPIEYEVVLNEEEEEDKKAALKKEEEKKEEKKEDAKDDKEAADKAEKEKEEQKQKEKRELELLIEKSQRIIIHNTLKITPDDLNFNDIILHKKEGLLRIHDLTQEDGVKTGFICKRRENGADKTGEDEKVEYKFGIDEMN